MVKVIFLNLLRSKYKIKQILVNPGTVETVFQQVITIYPQIQINDLKNAVLFINQEKVMHLNRLNELVVDGDELVLTHFVGGG